MWWEFQGRPVTSWAPLTTNVPVVSQISQVGWTVPFYTVVGVSSASNAAIVISHF